MGQYRQRARCRPSWLLHRSTISNRPVLVVTGSEWQVSGSIDDLVLKKSEKRNHHLTSPQGTLTTLSMLHGLQYSTQVKV